MSAESQLKLLALNHPVFVTVPPVVSSLRWIYRTQSALTKALKFIPHPGALVSVRQVQLMYCAGICRGAIGAVTY